MLSELAQHERALDEQVAQARAAAERDIEAARAQAARILQTAQERADAMSSEHAESLEAEVREIAGAPHEDPRRTDEVQMGRAVEVILRAVLP